MKKFITAILSTVFMCTFAFGTLSGCTKRENVLKIYNWGDYMDEDVRDGFADWYKAKTNQKVKVEYSEFDTNEDLYITIKQAKKDWDLVCPSDYMIEKLIKDTDDKGEKMLLEIDKSIVDITVPGFAGNELNLMSEITDFTKYCVPYVFGTFGIMYNKDKGLTAADVSSWSALWDSKYNGDVFMKNSVRYSYAVASFYAKSGQIAAATNNFSSTGYSNPEYKNILASIFGDYGDANRTAAKNALTAQKSAVNPSYEVDSGKSDLAKGEKKLGLFWSCDAGFIFNERETDSSLQDIWYEVPKEGTNIWVDGWVIPKYAKNTKAANYFLKYLMEKGNAIANSKYAGAASINKEAMTEWRAEIQDKATGDKQDYYEMYIKTIFGSDDIFARAAILRDYGDMDFAMNQLWSDVRK